MRRPGRWIAEAPGNTEAHGYHVPRLLAPWCDLPALIARSGRRDSEPSTLCLGSRGLRGADEIEARDVGQGPQNLERPFDGYDAEVLVVSHAAAPHRPCE